MWFRSVIDYLTCTTGQKNRRRLAERRSSSRRLLLEPLEDRRLLTSYVLTDLGSLSGAADGQTQAYDVNASGQVVGLSYSDAFSQDSRAFLWYDGTMIDLGTLGGLSSAAFAINDLGQVVGRANVVGGEYTDDRVVHAFLLTPEDTNGDGSPDRWFRDLDGNGANDLMTDLGLQPGAIGSSASDINNAGQVVGNADFAGRSSAVQWTAGAMTELGTLGGDWSHAYGINDGGQVVGFAYDAMGRQRAFLWDSSRGMTDVGTAGEYAAAWATAINTTGSVVGGLDSGPTPYSAFAWTPDEPNSTTGTMTDLGPGDYSWGADVNHAGQVVGAYHVYLPDDDCTPDYSGYPNCGWHYESRAMLWDNGLATDLNGVLSGSSFTLETAEAINASGQIVGTAVNLSGYWRAYLLTPADTLPALSIGDVTVVEGHSGDVSAVFAVSLSAAYDQTVTVTYASADGSATAGSDYAVASGTLSFAPGQTSQTITIAVFGDRLGEPNETFFINLNSPTNASIADGQGLAVIMDDEPRISISDVNKSEGKKGQTTLFTFTVTLSAAYDQPVTMSYRTVDGTAKSSQGDYIAKTGTLTFAPGETAKTITVTVKGDHKREGNEMFYLELFGLSSNASFTNNRGLGTILNDD